MLAQRVVAGVVVAGEVGQAQHKIATVEILVDGVVHRRGRRDGERALLKTPGEETRARTRARTRADGELNKDGQVQTRRLMDGTCDFHPSTDYEKSYV